MTSSSGRLCNLVSLTRSLTSVSVAHWCRVGLTHFQHGDVRVSISGSGDTVEEAETRDQARTQATYDRT